MKTKKRQFEILARPVFCRKQGFSDDGPRWILDSPQEVENSSLSAKKKKKREQDGPSFRLFLDIGRVALENNAQYRCKLCGQ